MIPNSTVVLKSDQDLAIYYNDDPDGERAEQGLQSFPLINQALGNKELQSWMMAPAEQIALLFLLEQLRPKVAIEIGTRFGGSLQVLARFCETVYSLDIDPEVSRRLDGKYQNVEFLIGPSEQTLPPLIERLQQEKAELSFALVDGDHSAEGVRRDIQNLLKFVPNVSFYIVMHDSFNPGCRRGLQTAPWSVQSIRSRGGTRLRSRYGKPFTCVSKPTLGRISARNPISTQAYWTLRNHRPSRPNV